MPRRAIRLVSRLAAIGSLLGCSNEPLRLLDPVVVAMTDEVAPVYDDGELVLYEVRTAVELPIVAPTGPQLERLRQQPPVQPFARYPWLEEGDVAVQVHYAITNLDPESHAVWFTVDPWNEFGRYRPAIVVADEEASRDFSGVDLLFRVPGTEDDDLSGADELGRVVGTLTFEDLSELARDLATVFQIVSEVEVDPSETGDPRSMLVNHALNVRNRTYNSPLTAEYIPSVVPGLTGFDVGLRAEAPGNLAVEVFVELVDAHGARLSTGGAAFETANVTVSSTGFN